MKPVTGWDWISLRRRLRREYLLSLASFGLLLVVGRGIGARAGWSVGWREFLAVVLVFGLSHLLACLFHHIPPGPEQGLSRLSLAAFCRTFVPLLALLAIHNYIFPLINEANVGSIIAAYLTSLALTFVSAGFGPPG